MRTIDGKRYISAREYAEMKDLTPGRVSQLKAELPFVKFEELGIELIDYDLIELSESEKTLAQTKFQTFKKVHELSYKDLGNYFSNLLLDLVKFKGTADSQISHLEAKTYDLEQKLEVSENERSESQSQVASLQKMNEELQKELQDLKTAHEELVVNHDLLSKEHQDLQIIQQSTQQNLELKITENKILSADIENLKGQLKSSDEIKEDFKDEFKNMRELMMEVMKQKRD